MKRNVVQPKHTCGSVNPKTMVHLVVGVRMVGKDEVKILEICRHAAASHRNVADSLSRTRRVRDRLRQPGHVQASAFFFACCSSRIPPMNNSTAAMQMQESATLKAGHQPPLDGTSLSYSGSLMATKSTT